MSHRKLSEWSIDGPTTLSGSDDDARYLVIRADINDPDNEREVALVGAWDLEGEWNAQLIAAAPKMYAACQAVIQRWETGDLAEAARMCSEALAGVPEAPRRLAEAQDYDRTIRLDCYGITIRLAREHTDERPGSGAITSDLRDRGDGSEDFCSAIDGLESLILAHACAGIDVEAPAYVEGIETAVEAIFNNL